MLQLFSSHDEHFLTPCTSLPTKTQTWQWDSIPDLIYVMCKMGHFWCKGAILARYPFRCHQRLHTGDSEMQALVQWVNVLHLNHRVTAAPCNVSSVHRRPNTDKHVSLDVLLVAPPPHPGCLDIYLFYLLTITVINSTMHPTNRPNTTLHRHLDTFYRFK